MKEKGDDTIRKLSNATKHTVVKRIMTKGETNENVDKNARATWIEIYPPDIRVMC